MFITYKNYAAAGFLNHIRYTSRSDRGLLLYAYERGHLVVISKIAARSPKHQVLLVPGNRKQRRKERRNDDLRITKQ